MVSPLTLLKLCVIYCNVLILIMSNELNKQNTKLCSTVHVNVGGRKDKNVWESWFKAPTADIYEGILGSDHALSRRHVSSLSPSPILHGFLLQSHI